MGFVIVDDVEARDAFPRVWRVPLVLIGLALVLVGLVAFLPAMFVIGAIVLGFRLNGTVELGDEPATWLWVVGGVLAGYVVLRVGIRLLRGARQSALFLRRFGFTDATEALSTAVARGLGRRWRLVTLDDSKVAPVGVGGRSQWLFRVTPWLLGVGLFVILVWVLPGLFESQLDSAIDDVVSQTVDEADDPISAVFGAFLATLIVGLVVGMILFIVTLAPAALAGSVLLFSVGGRRAIRRAERRRATEVNEAGEVDDVTRRVRRQARRIYAPRLTVVRCADTVWQTVVRRLAELTDAIVIDVSEVSGGLLWELHELGPTRGREWVLVGRRDRLESLLSEDTPHAAQLRTVLDGQSVLAYRVDRFDRFETSLRARLTHVR
ncbi:MAG: hypothetical protein ACRD2W_16330 [Acidimicrobiales bacterium]